MEMRERTPKSIKEKKNYEDIISSQYDGSKKKTVSSRKINKNSDKKKAKISQKNNIENDIEIRNNSVYNDKIVNNNIPNQIKTNKKIKNKIHHESAENTKNYDDDDDIKNSCNDSQKNDNNILSISSQLNYSKSGEENNSLNNQGYKRGRRKTKQHKDDFFCYYDEIENEEEEISSEEYESEQGKKNKKTPNEKKKQNNDSISNKFNDFIKKENDIYDYNLDLFYFLSNFKTKQDNTQNLNKLVLFILHEIDGKQILDNNNNVENKMNKTKKTNKPFVNIKENIDIEYITNHDKKDIRNVFFFENIKINYNDTNAVISPFKSSLVVDNNVANISSQKKKKNTK